MATATEFSIFPQLPVEIRLQIWKEAVLEEYRDRILLLDETAHRIVITRELQKPFRAVFHANFESRSVANELFPLRLPVHAFTQQMRTDLWYYQWVIEHNVQPQQLSPLEGEIPVSLERDHFLLGLGWWDLSQTYSYVDHQRAGLFVGAFTTGELEPAMLAKVRCLIDAIKGEPSEAVRLDPERCLPLHPSIDDTFVRVEVFRRIHMADHFGLRDLGEYTSYYMPDTRMEGDSPHDTRDGPSYNGRKILGRESWWMEIHTCHDVQARLARQKLASSGGTRRTLFRSVIVRAGYEVWRDN
ncbi:hypothetical protein PG996_008289 [Apiospora saccharicola]|uniref:2EXR domain-containing protein n=1 Tax=Apiospora saccharicola TaxID=335842 RepID=A0ABR1UY61_9PEZI